MDLDAVPDFLLWTLFALVCIDILRRVSYHSTFHYLRSKYNAYRNPIYPEKDSLYLHLGQYCYLDPLVSFGEFFPDYKRTEAGKLPWQTSEVRRFYPTGLSPDLIKWLTRRYPNVNALSLDMSCDDLNYSIQLLQSYSAQLKYLILRYEFVAKYPNDAGNICALLKVIEVMPRLTHLRLKFSKPFPNRGQELSFEPISTLQHFELTSPNNSMFAKMSVNRILRIDLGNESIVDQTSLVNKIPSIRPKVMWLKTRCFEPLDQLKLDQLCSTLPNLTSLSISVDELYLVQLVNTLSALKQLCALDVQVLARPVDPIAQSNRIPQERIARLTTVSWLRLRLNLTSHDDLHSKHLGWIFPNLTSLHIDHNDYPCNICIDKNIFTLLIEGKCTDQLVEPWRQQCRKLKHVTFHRHPGYWTSPSWTP